MPQSKKRFPILDRPAPVIERIRSLRNNSNGDDLTRISFTAEMVARASLLEDDEERSEGAERAGEEFRKSLANHLGVDEEAINDDIVETFTELFQEHDEIVDTSKVDQLSDDEEDEGGEDQLFG